MGECWEPQLWAQHQGAMSCPCYSQFPVTLPLAEGPGMASYMPGHGGIVTCELVLGMVSERQVKRFGPYETTWSLMKVELSEPSQSLGVEGSVGVVRRSTPSSPSPGFTVQA